MIAVMKSERSGLVQKGIGFLLYRMCLDFVYINFVCEEYAYCKNFHISFDIYSYMLSWLLYMILLWISIPKNRDITSYYLIIQLAIMIAPMLTMWGVKSHTGIFMWYVVFVHFLQCLMNRHIHFKGYSWLREGRTIAKAVIVVLTGSSFVLVFWLYGIPSLQALDLTNVYEIRQRTKMVFPLSYMLPWFFSVIAPFLLIKYLQLKKYAGIILIGMVMLFFYLTFAHKTWFFSFFMVAVVYYFVKRNRFVEALGYGVTAGILLTYVLFCVSEKLLLLPSLLIRRTLFVPADLKFEYYNFFSKNPKLHFSEGMIGRLFGFQSPYTEKGALIIGKFNGSGASANTGYMADAYANAGVIGMFVIGILLILILKWLDSVSNEDLFICNFSVLAYALYGLNDQAFLTRCLTGGLGLLCVMLFLQYIPRESGRIECASVER